MKLLVGTISEFSIINCTTLNHYMVWMKIDTKEYRIFMTFLFLSKITILDATLTIFCLQFWRQRFFMCVMLILYSNAETLRACATDNELGPQSNVEACKNYILRIKEVRRISIVKSLLFSKSIFFREIWNQFILIWVYHRHQVFLPLLFNQIFGPQYSLQCLKMCHTTKDLECNQTCLLFLSNKWLKSEVLNQSL